MDKENYLPWLMLGWQTNEHRQALAYFRQAAELKPGDPVVIDSMTYTRENLNIRTNSQVQAGDPLTAQLEQPHSPTLVEESGNPANNTLERWLGRARHPFMLYFLYLAGITLAEFLTALSTPQVGLVLHGLLLVLLLIQAAFSQQKVQYRVYLVLAFAPLVRLLSLSMPLLQFEFMNWYMVIGIPLFLAALIALRLTGYTPGQVGLGPGRRWWLQGLVALSGLGLGYLEYLILDPEPLIETLSWDQFWYPAVILMIFTGFLEEFIFRGMVQRANLQSMGEWGLVFTASIFAVLHIGYLSIMDLLFVFVVGLYFSLVVHRSQSIWGVTLAHGLTNIGLFLIFPFAAM